MSANVVFLVEVTVSTVETIEVSAVTADEATEEALQRTGVLYVHSVKHRDEEEYESKQNY